MFLTSKKSRCCTCFCFPELKCEEQSGPAGTAETQRPAKAFLDAAASLLDIERGAGGDTGSGPKAAEVRQLHRHWGNMSQVGQKFPRRPSSRWGSSWQPLSCAFGVPPLPPEWCVLRKTGKAVSGMHFIKYDLLHQTKHTYKIPTEGQKGVAATLRGLLLKSYSVAASSSLGCVGWTVQNVHDANQHLLCRAHTAIWQSGPHYPRLSLATPYLPNFWFRHLQICLQAPPRARQSPWHACHN